MKALSALDLLLNSFVFMPEYYYIADWSPGVQVAIRNNQCGDVLNVFFTPSGTLIKGFAHESFMSPYGDADFVVQKVDGVECYPGLLEGVPVDLMPYCLSTDGGIEYPTTIVWCAPSGTWQRGKFEWPKGDEAN